MHVASIDRISQILVGSRAIIDYQLHDNYAKKGQRSKSGGQIDSRNIVSRSYIEFQNNDNGKMLTFMIILRCLQHAI